MTDFLGKKVSPCPLFIKPEFLLRRRSALHVPRIPRLNVSTCKSAISFCPANSCRGSSRLTINCGDPRIRFLKDMSKLTILMLGDPAKTVRWRSTQFERFTSNYTIKVNQDLAYSSFETALREKKSAPTQIF